jgi:hypothetical protein
MGINAYTGPVFCQYIRAKQLGMNPEIQYRWKFLPVCVTHSKAI